MNLARGVLAGLTIGAIVILSPQAVAQGPSSAEHTRHTGGADLVAAVRSATKPFHDVNAALAAGYRPFLGCVSGQVEGAMGVHYVNGDLVADGELDPARPESLMYEAKDGRLQLLGAEYIVMAAAWDASHESPPTLMGQVFHYNGSPNRYGLPAFYELHVWAWRDNPRGMFVDWNPRVTCEGFSG
jgi:hypothetical protein